MFEAGKQVICIKTAASGIVEKGKAYELLAIKKGCKHAPIILNIDVLRPTNSENKCVECGLVANDVHVWLCATFFAPIDNTKSDITAEELLEELEPQHSLY